MARGERDRASEDNDDAWGRRARISLATGRPADPAIPMGTLAADPTVRRRRSRASASSAAAEYMHALATGRATHAMQGRGTKQLLQLLLGSS